MRDPQRSNKFLLPKAKKSELGLFIKQRPTGKNYSFQVLKMALESGLSDFHTSIGPTESCYQSQYHPCSGWGEFA